MCIAFWKKKKPYVRTNIHDHYQTKEKETVLESENIIVEEIKEAIPLDIKKLKAAKYHVSQNKEKDAKSYLKWRIRKESSDKTIKYFDTQKQAIDYAQELATQAKTTVVIHKLDGSIRKQDYSSKD